ncbi:MAG: dihydropteroate synthase, partial [Candidatus Methanomethylophilus sp.]|nr:dihydropteroate synthase [Methanomethylophilus sp.]
VSGLADPAMAATAAELDVPLVLMSSYGTPATFKTQFIPGDPVRYACDMLADLIRKALEAGVKEHNIILDPGVGFGTTPEQAMEMILHTSEFSFGKYPVLIGPSRKRFLAKTYPQLDADSATAEVCVLAAEHGADILRVHDVSATASRFSV